MELTAVKRTDLEDWTEVSEMVQYSAGILDSEKRKQIRT